MASCALPFAALIWRYDFLCDDAYISFRYALNLARGLGLAYNPGEEPPVEGFTNLLWVLWMALWERLGPGSEVGSRLTSVACALLLLLLLARHLVALPGSGSGWARVALVFLATFPPLAVWATGGLETMAFTLCVFALYDRLAGDPMRPRTGQAALAGVLALLLRADGFVWVALVLLGSALDARSRGSTELVRASLQTAAALVIAFAGLLVWRWTTFGTLEPNTARIKIALGLISVDRGARYLANFLLTFPSVLLVLMLAVAAHARTKGAGARGAATVVLGNFIYVVLVGGDFMAMGRFLVPAVPFLTVLLGLALQRLASTTRRGTLLAAAGAVMCAALSLPAAFDGLLVPRSLLEALDFRWSSGVFRTEQEKWRAMKEDAAAWATQGRMLARIARPGDSLVIGTIGAVGYHSGLVIHDRMGLVNREELEQDDDAPRRSAGHERRVPYATLAAKRPTFLESRFVPADRRLLALPRALQPGGELHAQARLDWIVPEQGDGVPEGILLRVVRYAP